MTLNIVTPSVEATVAERNFPDGRRLDCIEAAAEMVGHLLGLLTDAVVQANGEDAEMTVRALVPRLRQLNDAIAKAAGSEDATFDGVAAMIHQGREVQHA